MKKSKSRTLFANKKLSLLYSAVIFFNFKIDYEFKFLNSVKRLVKPYITLLSLRSIFINFVIFYPRSGFMVQMDASPLINDYAVVDIKAFSVGSGIHLCFKLWCENFVEFTSWLFESVIAMFGFGFGRFIEVGVTSYFVPSLFVRSNVLNITVFVVMVFKANIDLDANLFMVNLPLLLMILSLLGVVIPLLGAALHTALECTGYDCVSVILLPNSML